MADEVVGLGFGVAEDVVGEGVGDGEVVGVGVADGIGRPGFEAVAPVPLVTTWVRSYVTS